MVVAPVVEKNVDIPEGVDVIVEGGIVTVKGGDTTLTRRLDHPKVEISVEGSSVRVSCRMPRKREKALVGTMVSHIANMIRGVSEPFTYTMRVVYAHFPVKVTAKDREVVIDNFLGERYPRKASILGETVVDVKGDTLTITGPDVEHVSQTAANIEQATRIKNKDTRVFQDGIYLVSKGED